MVSMNSPVLPQDIPKSVMEASFLIKTTKTTQVQSIHENETLTMNLAGSHQKVMTNEYLNRI